MHPTSYGEYVVGPAPPDPVRDGRPADLEFSVAVLYFP